MLREIKAADGLLRPGDLLYFIGRWKTASVRPEQAAAIGPDRQGAPGRVGLPPLSEGPEGGRGGRFRRPALCTEELFQRFPKVRTAEAGRFDHLLVDEYQDTNGSQYRIVKALAGRAPQPVRRGRRRPVDLRLARGRGDPHPRLPEGLARRQRSSGWKTITARRGRSWPGPIG